MPNISQEDLDFLMAMAGWLFAEGFALFSYEDEKNFERLMKKYAKS